ncbi:hypothetical protein MAR_024611 [Mya arenaria]|uniref:Uncharacterized protein n=1 Tax=Mya arenaria TaxID=6604 RepID=A0ABY7DTM8_MYAAR|nr:hypothetical protein MAR_024611 [Mya arenaria]
MQRPMVKAERHDPAYLPPSYHLQQQLQQQQQQQKQRQMAPQTQNSFPPNKGVPPKAPNTTNTSTPVDAQSIESQIDFQSIKGAFGWTVIDNIHIPYILRVDKQFVSVRIVEQKLLSRYPNSYPDDLDLIVLLSDFIRFYDLVKKTFPDAAAARAAQMAAESAGWLQIKNTVTPYDLEKYFPQLSYMFPSKEAIAQSEKDIDCNGQSDVNLESENLGIPANGMLTPEDIEASMPVSAAELSRNGAREGIGKRPVGTSGGPPSKQPRTAAAISFKGHVEDLPELKRSFMTVTSSEAVALVCWHIEIALF